ncbi:MAG TPA: protease inhibitor I9 family protein [Pyrinomonadaceae bacterium]|nr:protease inhibitor I9 family protein [Pyrinomonadaceae bacterium]
MKRIFVVWLLILAAMATPLALNIGRAHSSNELHQPVGDVIPNQYIIVFKEDASLDVARKAAKLSASFGGDILYQYEHSLKGFAARLSDVAVEAISKDPAVAFVEADIEVRLDTTQFQSTFMGLGSRRPADSSLQQRLCVWQHRSGR